MERNGRNITLLLLAGVLFLAGVEIVYCYGSFSNRPPYEIGMDYLDGRRVRPDRSKAMRFLLLAADSGHVPAQFQLGRCYGTSDIPSARRYLKEALANGHPEALSGLIDLESRIGQADSELLSCLLLLPPNQDPNIEMQIAECYQNGWGSAKNPEKAAEHYRNAARLKHPEAQRRLMALLETMDRAEELLAEYRRMALEGNVEAQLKLAAHSAAAQPHIAFDWYQRAADAGNAFAQNKLGEFYRSGRGVPQDNAAAVRYFQLAAAQKLPEAQSNLADCYYQGRGVKRNRARARTEYRRLAEQGMPLAQYRFGLSYDEDAEECGNAKDWKEAVKWYALAAAQSLPEAQNRLGLCYANGHGTAMDQAAAAAWFRRGAKQGNADAQCNLGKALLFGRGIPVDFAGAAHFFTLAAGQNSAEAQFYLARCYAMGAGVEKSPAKAAAWYEKAMEQNFVPAAAALAELLANGPEKNHARAIELFLPLAEKGDSKAQAALAALYNAGNNVPQALAWSQKAIGTTEDAEQRNAMLILQGNIYLADSNLEQACIRYEKAFANGAAATEGALALCLLADGPQRDLTRGIRHLDRLPAARREQLLSSLEQRAARGDIGAQCTLAYCNFQGIGGEKNPARCLEYLQMSAGKNHLQARELAALLEQRTKGGDAAAADLFGCCLLSGAGVGKDLERGIQLLSGQRELSKPALSLLKHLAISANHAGSQALLARYYLARWDEELGKLYLDAARRNNAAMYPEIKEWYDNYRKFRPLANLILTALPSNPAFGNLLPLLQARAAKNQIVIVGVDLPGSIGARPVPCPAPNSTLFGVLEAACPELGLTFDFSDPIVLLSPLENPCEFRPQEVPEGMESLLRSISLPPGNGEISLAGLVDRLTTGAVSVRWHPGVPEETKQRRLVLNTPELSLRQLLNIIGAAGRLDLLFPGENIVILKGNP